MPSRQRRSDEAELMPACPPIAGQKRTRPWIRVGLKSGRRGPAQQPTLRNVQWRLGTDLDFPRPSGNDLSMDQISPLPALTQDEVYLRSGLCVLVFLIA